MAKKVVASITKLESLKGGDKELYVLALASDLRGEQAGTNVIAANNQDILTLMPDIAEKSVSKWMVVSVSNIFEHIKPGIPASLSGSGIILYPNLDPKGLLGLYIAVIDSDSGHRSMGKLLKGIFDNDDIKKQVTALTSAPLITSPLIGGLMRTATSLVPSILSKNKDDLLLAHNHSGFDFDNYGVDSMLPFQDFQIGNNLIKATLRIRIVDTV